ncbi:hypothetical protein ILUMI_01097, partial [Ignelater luminosus]
MSSRHTVDKALTILRGLPRICLSNIRDNPGSKMHGAGNKGSGQRQNYMRLGYETGNRPFYTRFGYEPYYRGHQ